MAYKARKRKVKKNVPVGAVHIQATFNNTIITISDENGNEFKMVKHKGKIYYCLIVNQYLPKVQLYNTFGQFCQMVNIKNVKPIFNETDKKYV